MRLTIRATFPDDAKHRVKTAMRLLGAKEIRVEEEGDVKKAVKRLTSKNLPTSPEALALHALYGRKAGTEWNEKEIKAFRAAKATGSLTLENITTITAYYAAERAKGEKGFHRRDLVTLLNNFPGEVDKAQPYRVLKAATVKDLSEPPGFREWLKARNPDCNYGWNNLPPFLEGLQREFKEAHPDLGWRGMLYVGVA